MKKREITTTELFEAISAFSEEMMRQFTKCATKEDIKAIRAEMATKEDIRAIRAEMATKKELAAVRAEMATKEALRACATKDDLQQEIGKVLRIFPPVVHRADSKTNALMERLVQKHVLARKDVEDILAIHPLLS